MNQIDEAKIDILKNEIRLSDRWQYDVKCHNPCIVPDSVTEDQRHPYAYCDFVLPDEQPVTVHLIRLPCLYLLDVLYPVSDPVLYPVREFRDLINPPTELEIERLVVEWGAKRKPKSAPKAL